MASALLAHQFNKDITPVIESIGTPLLNTFGITHYGLIKVNNEQLMLRLSNHERWNEIYTQEKFYNDLEMYGMESVPINGMRKRILTGEPSTKHEKILYEQNLWNFLLLYERTENEGSFFFFGTDRDNKKVLDYYINYPQIFDRFVLHFKEQMSSFLKVEEKKCIQLEINPLAGAVTPQNLQINQAEIYDFYQKTEISRLNLGAGFENVKLSKREIECLYYLVHGKTVKDIAQTLNLSPRTIEWYVNKIKEKTGIFSKSVLAQKFFSIASVLEQVLN